MTDNFKLTFFGHETTYFEQIDSTNDWLKNETNLSKSYTPKLVHTDYQTNGRGQYGNHWEASSGKNLLFSFSFNPQDFPLERLHLISQEITLIIIRVLNEIYLSIFKIKWPNDIILNDKKVGGILLETILNKNQIQSIIVGIGINVNQSDFDSNLKNANSLKNLTGIEILPKSILKKLALEFENTISDIQTNSIDDNTKTFNQNLFKLNQNYLIKKDNKILECVNLGVDQNGYLILKNISSNSITIVKSSREIEFIY